MSEFEACSLQHFTALASIALVSTGGAMWGRRAEARSRRLGAQVLGAGILTYVGLAYYERFQDGIPALGYALPLYLCDLTVLICLAAILTHRQTLFELAYYWGLAGAFQALLTPDLDQGFPSYFFFEYFLGHGLIFASVFYLVGAYRMAPRPGSVLRMMAFLNLYILAVGSLDALFGWNYGYLCRPPEHPSLLDAMGPWPYYLVTGELVAGMNFLLLSLPWKVWRKQVPEASGRITPHLEGNEARP